MNFRKIWFKYRLLLLTLSLFPAFLMSSENISFEKTKATKLLSKSFNFTNQQFNIDSPFDIGVSYNRNRGVIIDARYSKLFAENSAFSLAVELGNRNYRASGTLAHVFNDKHRAKITSETLRQKQKYTFRSGDADEWIKQSGIGFEYKYLNLNKLSSAAHIGADYVTSSSKELSDETWLSESATEYEVFNNKRRIAGADRKGLRAGLDIDLRPSSKLKLEWNYDDIKYNTQLSATPQHFGGHGATLNWAEQLNNKTTLNVIASTREPYTQYQAQINRHLNKALFGLPAVLQFGVSQQTGKHGLTDDTRSMLRLTFGDKTKVSPVFNKKPSSKAIATHSSLLTWASKPALYESNVLTQVNQEASDERLAVVTKTDLETTGSTIDKNSELSVGSVTGIAINQVTENGIAISFSEKQFRLENGQLIIGLSKLNSPANYFVSLEQDNGQFSHVSFATFTGSVGLSFINIEKDQLSASQSSTTTSFFNSADNGKLNNVAINENTHIIIETYTAFSGERLRFGAGSSLPSGLSINASSGVITGTTPNIKDTDSIEFDISITATDENAEVTSKDFTITVINTDRSDDTPTVTTTADATVTTCTGPPSTAHIGLGLVIDLIDGNCEIGSTFGGSTGNGASITITPTDDTNDGTQVNVSAFSNGATYVSGSTGIVTEGSLTTVVEIGGTNYSVSYTVTDDAADDLSMSSATVTRQ